MSKEREAATIDANIGARGGGASERAEGQPQINVNHYPPNGGSIGVGGLYSLQASYSSEVYLDKGGMQIGSGLGMPSVQTSAGAQGLQQHHQTATQKYVQQQGSMFNNNGMNNNMNMMVMSMSNINTSTPCAACKLLRRRCAQECPFAPYFSPHEPQRFASVHKIYGASNVSKMLLEVPEMQRADAANSLVYEANARLRDPIYGCMGLVSTLQHQAHALQVELNAVKGEVMRYRARSTCNNQPLQVDQVQALHQHPHSSAFNTPATPCTPPLAIDHHLGPALNRSGQPLPTTIAATLGNDHYLGISAHLPSSMAPLSSLPQNLDTKDRIHSWS